MAHRVAPPTGDPGYAPASKYIVNSAAVMMPELANPILALAQVAEVGPVPSKTSFLDIITLTGLPLFWDNTAATGSK